jgi:uncharacterized RDD family membrane protein YckC
MPFRNVGPFNYLISSLVFTAYWTYFESTSGQSIGKKILHLKTTGLQGENIDLKTAVLESLGKAFLLPLDVVLGWIFTNDKRQRIFNVVLFLVLHLVSRSLPHQLGQMRH